MNEAPQAATCPRCGGSFSCGAASGPSGPCDCFGIRLGAAQRAEIAARWPGRCLCLACLRELSEAEPTQPVIGAAKASG